MNKHLQQRIKDLFSQYDTAVLATCGPAKIQVSHINYEARGLNLQLFIPPGSDHLFNLETQPALALMTSGWKLHGQGHIAELTSIYGRKIVIVEATRLHILNNQHTVETIDF